ncbi:hypothetical protein FRC01_009595 [Tulasnella sp. 417]|nr:hypothetical protein FRC01_009595 [Tulasnella sp. 417]
MPKSAPLLLATNSPLTSQVSIDSWLKLQCSPPHLKMNESARANHLVKMWQPAFRCATRLFDLLLTTLTILGMQQYILPADAPEHRRLDLQQMLLSRVRDGLFLHKDGVHRALTPKPGDPTPVIIDLGCGSGFWTMEMAKQFPDADVIGIDLVVPTPASPIPPNCRFEQHDLNNGLAGYQNAANVIHASCVAQGIINYQKLMDEIWEALRPGGVYLTVAGDMQMLDHNKEPWMVREDEEKEFSYHVLMMTKSWDAMKAKGPGISSYSEIPSWIEQMGSEKWEASGVEHKYVPIGPWEENMTEHDKQTAELMRQDMIRLQNALVPGIRAYGIPEETVQRWLGGARDELVNMRKHIYCHWLFTWAVKHQGGSE